MQFHTDDGISFTETFVSMIANILAVIFLLKLSSKTHFFVF